LQITLDVAMENFPSMPAVWARQFAAQRCCPKRVWHEQLECSFDPMCWSRTARDLETLWAWRGWNRSLFAPVGRLWRKELDWRALYLIVIMQN